MGKPMPGAVNAMNILKSQGAILVIFCLWANGETQRGAISEWLRYFNIPYDFITNVKPDVDYIIDDKAIHHTEWSETLKEINKRVQLKYGYQPDEFQNRA